MIENQLRLDDSTTLAFVEDTSPLTYTRLQCPYCMYSSKSITDFQIFNGKSNSRSVDLLTGKPVMEKGNPSKKMAHCPQCKNTIRIKTLIQTFKMTYGDYAQWLYWVAKYDADRRVKWSLLFEAFKGTDFWKIYRAFKEQVRRNMENTKSVSDPDILEDPENLYE